MCELAYHNCPTCHEEYRCDQHNTECPVYNGFDEVCGKCEHWIDEERRDMEREERLKYERDQWIEEYGWKEE